MLNSSVIIDTVIIRAYSSLLQRGPTFDGIYIQNTATILRPM